MATESGTPGIQNLTVEELRELTQSLSEAEFKLVDARERNEYDQAHIPGAVLVPLSEIVGEGETVSPAAHTVFYCRSGNRSMMAASALVQRGVLGSGKVYNLVGGISAYNGIKLAEFPRLRVFDDTGSVDDIILRAMDLEKGAHLFYGQLLTHFEGTPNAEMVQRLAKSEVVHAVELHKMLGDAPEPFEQVFDGLEGKLVESGESMEDVARRMASWAGEGDAALLELALEMEFCAYDLYRNMAERSEGDQLKQAFQGLAAQEQTHAKALLNGLGQLAGR